MEIQLIICQEVQRETVASTNGKLCTTVKYAQL